MKDKIKTITKKSLSLLLSLIMIVSILPAGRIIAEADTMNLSLFYEKLEEFKRTKFGDVSPYNYKNSGKYGNQCFGFANEIADYIFGSFPTGSMSARSVNSNWVVSRGGGAVDNLCVGDLVRYECHSIFITDIKGSTIYYCDANNKYSPEGKLAYAANTVKYNRYTDKSRLKARVSKWLTSEGATSVGWVAHCKTGIKNNISFKVESKDATKIENTSATISAVLNTTAPVQKWGYYIGKNKSEVSNVDGTNATVTHKDTSTMDYCRVNDWSNSPQQTKNFSVNISKMLSNKLTPNTTYYYKFVVKINDFWYQSGVNSFKTKQEKPKATTISVAKGYTDIGIKQIANVTWSKASGADSYIIKVYNNSTGKQVGSSITNIKGTKYTIPAKYFATAGTYYFTLTAKNDAGETLCTSKPTVTVHKNSTVTFYDTVSNKNISTQSVVYGKAAAAPQSPSQTGYTFSKWDRSFSKVTGDIKVSTVYTPNKYTVKFVDGYNNNVISSDKFTFKTKITEYDYPNAPEHKGYTFSGWSENDYTVGAETHTIYASYKWNSTYNIRTEITSVERAKSDNSESKNDGYNVVVNVITPSISAGGTTKTIKGRVVVALKTKNGRLLIETESAAFVLYPDATKEQSKKIEIFVPYEATEEDLAYSTEAYVVNDYNSAGIISDVAVDTLKTAATNNEEWKYDTSKPVVGVNGVVDTNDNLNFVTYDLVTKTTKDSLATSLSGYSLKTSAWVKTGSGTINYVKSWPALGNTAGVASAGSSGSKFNKNTTVGNYLYTTYNKTPKKASESATVKVTTSETLKGGIYYHWCRNWNNGILNHNVCAQKWYADKTTGYKYYTFHAFYVGGDDDTAFLKTNKYVADFEKNLYERNLSSSDAKDYRDKCTDSKWWNKRIPVYKQSWEQYNKKFTYTKTTTKSNQKATTMSAIPKDATNTTSTTSSGVTLNTTVATSAINKKQWYAYKTEINVSHTDKNKYDLYAQVGNAYANKNVTVYVYKYSQVADYTTEYIGTSTIDNNGNLNIPQAQMREACTESTGDFTIAVALPGETNALVVGTIESPKPQYTVKFYDYDGETVVYEETIEEGGTVTAPFEDLLNIPEGYEFSGWDLSTVGVHSDLVVHPMSKEKVCVVTFIDWENQEFEMKEIPYGDPIEDWLPEAASTDGYVITWDLSNCKTITQTSSDIDEETGESVESKQDVYIVTENTVITTVYDEMVCSATFLSPESEIVENGSLDERDNDGLLIDSEIIDNIGSSDIETIQEFNYFDRVDTPETFEESEDYIFYGWRNVETGEYLNDTDLTESATYYPVYEFANTVETPSADIATGEYNSNQVITLNCDTENAIIYYTTDGTEPKTSETAIEYTGPITITKSCTFKFYASAFGMNNSSTVTELYAINTASSSVTYHIVTVHSNIQQESMCYQTLQKDSTKFNDSVLRDVTGYTYNGLFDNENYTSEFITSSEKITESITLYAKYTPLKFTVTFLDDDNSVIFTTTADYGQEIIPPTPTKSGCVFVGWDSDDWQFVTTDKTFTARYVLEDEYAKISISRISISSDVGTTYPLYKKVTISPIEFSDTELSWESDNCEVAEVDSNGNVNLIGIGVATITVTVNSTGESASCVFTVSKNSDSSIVLARNSMLDIDSQGYLRRITENKNTVAEIRNQFINEEISFYNRNNVLLSDNDIIGTGAIIKLIDNNDTLDELTTVMTGDINGDGHIGNADVSMLNRRLAGAIELSYEQQLAGDVNGDGYVDNKDASVISRYLVGKEKI